VCLGSSRSRSQGSDDFGYLVRSDGKGCLGMKSLIEGSGGGKKEVGKVDLGTGRWLLDVLNLHLD
jgi:hypothetical protein